MGPKSDGTQDTFLALNQSTSTHLQEQDPAKHIVYNELQAYMVPCIPSLRFHLSYLWKTWPFGQAFLPFRSTPGKTTQAPSTKWSTQCIRFIFACQGEFLPGKGTGNRSATYQRCRLTEALTCSLNRPKSISISL